VSIAFVESIGSIGFVGLIESIVFMKVVRFEDLEAWKEARTLVSQVYGAVRKTKDLKRDYRFCDQITAAAVSIMSNIAEGFSRRSSREFTQFLFIAKGSCGEVQSLLYVALDQQYLTVPEFQKLHAQSETVAKLTSGLITYLLNRTRKT
jgi:four helix bundle protein